MYRPTRWHRCCQFRRGDHPISCISKRAKTVEIKYRLSSHGPVAHLVIDATGLKVYGEGEWKIRKHGKEKRRVWRKLHLAVDAATHAIVAGR